MVKFISENWANILLIIVGSFALATYILQERKKKIDAASLIVLQIDEFQERLREISTFIVDGQLNETAFYESLPLMDTDYWNKYKHYFYCFGCGATGDVIDLVAKLFNLSSYDAAKKLAYDFGIDPDKPPAAAALRKPKYPLAKAFQKEELHCQRILYDYLHLLERWKMQYAPKTPEDTLDDRFVEACQMLDYIEDLTDILTFAELEGRVKTVDMLQKNGMINRLEERLKRTEKEVDARDETEIG